jgi:hypothetical protein
MWDLFKTLAKGAVIGLAIGLALDVYAELKKPKDGSVRESSTRQERA